MKPRTTAPSLSGLVLAAALLAGGCAGMGEPARLHYGLLDAPEGRRIMWPPEPDEPRYQFAGQLVGEVNFVREGEARGMKGFLAWVVGLFDEDRPNALQRPQAVVADESARRIYITDVGRPGVFVFDEAAGELKVWEHAQGLRPFITPVGVALASDGGLWVADADLALVARLDRDGNPRGTIGAGVLQRPTGLARDARGTLYVADTHAHDIKVFAEDGRLLRTLGTRGEGPGEFNYPTHLAVADGMLYVTDTLNNRIQVVPLEGGEPRVIGQRGLFYGNLVRPKGVGVDSDRNVYIVESLYDTLLVFNEAGEFLMPIGGSGHGTGKFQLPSGVWVDSFNRVFVADTFNGRVTLFQYLGGAKADGE